MIIFCGTGLLLSNLKYHLGPVVPMQVQVTASFVRVDVKDKQVLRAGRPEDFWPNGSQLRKVVDCMVYTLERGVCCFHL